MNNNKLNNEEISNAIKGGLRYLTDTFVFDPENYHIHPNNFTVKGSFKENHAVKYSALIRKKTGEYVIREKHIKNNWPGFINYTPRILKSPVKSAFLVTDYNLFTTVSTAIPFFLFNDNQLPAENRFIEHILKQVREVVNLYKRNDCYCFWPVNNNEKEPGMIRPVNIPSFIIDFRCNLHRLTGFLGLQKFRESDTLFKWLEKCYDKLENPSGSSALFNIPNDADNTSIAFIFRHFMEKRFPEMNNQSAVDLDIFGSFTDKNRGKTDRHNEKIGRETGAFLTWLKDENLPVFKNPGEGIIPLEANNVDIVVNANALFALSLCGKREITGFNEAVNLLIKCIENDNWAKASLYYPNKLHFPYALSRVWREAGFIKSRLEKALQKLLRQLITEQQVFEKQNSGFKGAYPCGEDGNFTYSTTLFLITLLNLGNKMAEIAGLKDEYDNSVKNAVSFIIRNGIKTRVVNKHHPHFPGNDEPVYWNSGVLYSSSIHDLAEWRSDPQFTSLVLEALAKYVLSYDLEPTGFLSRQICLNTNNNNLELTVSSF